MYSPDGFASLACALHEQCFFLPYQQPFIEIMLLLNKNPVLFFSLQALTWFVLIGLIYFLSKELNIKHLFLTPFFLIFSGTFFVHNFVGNFENDNFGIILVILSQIFLYKYLHKNKNVFQNNLHNLITSIIFLLMSLTIWVWIGHLGNFPRLISHITEEMFWTHWFSWLFLFPIIIVCLIQSIKKHYKTRTTMILIVLFFPKLLMLIIPFLLKFIDEILDKMLQIKNKRFYITLLVFGLLIGQITHVAINTSESWNREIKDQECVTVNDEYFLRATKGLNYTYNQIYGEELDKCKTKKSD